MGHDQLQRGDTINRQIEQVVREAGMGHLYEGNNDISRMLQHPDLKTVGKRRHLDNIFDLNLGKPGVQNLRYFESVGGVPKLQYKVRAGSVLVAFMFEPNRRLYGNFVDNGHDFEIDPSSRELRIRSLGGGMWEHTLRPYPEWGMVIMVPREIQDQYRPMRLTDVEFKDGAVELVAASGKYGSITFVLPTEVYRAG